MKNSLVFCVVFGCIAFASVQSASFYLRNGREVLIPVETELVGEQVVSDLRKEAEPLSVDVAELLVVPVVKDEVVAPVETLRNVEPVAEVQEPVAVVTNEKEAAAVIVEPALLKNVVAPVESPVEVAEVVAPVAVVAVEAADAPAALPETRVAEPVAVVEDAVVAAPAAVVETEKETVAEVESAMAVKRVALDDAPSDSGLVRQSEDGDSTARPSLIQQAQNTLSNIITNNPIANAISNIRQPENDAAAPAADGSTPAAGTTAAPATTSHRPNLIQQFQHNVQNIQHQLQTAFQNVAGGGGGGGAAANAGETSTNRPTGGLFQQVNQAIVQALNRPQNLVQSIFRPNANAQDAVNDQKEATPAPEVELDQPVQVVNEKVEVVDNKVETSVE